HRVWNGRAEEAIHSEDSERGRNMVPGILGAECGFGPGSAADGSAAGRRPLCRQRAESVDELRLDRELVRACGADGFQRAEAQRAFGAADRHEIAWSGSSS